MIKDPVRAGLLVVLIQNIPVLDRLSPPTLCPNPLRYQMQGLGPPLPL
jgi:hypothetical protein